MAATSLSANRARLDRAFNGILLGIGVQFFLGMWLNLYGTFPSGNGTLGTALTYTADPILILHIILAVVLVIGAVAILVFSVRDPLRFLRWFALGGFVSLVFATLTGSEFVASGYSSSAASFLMAVGFAGALTSYYEGLVRLRGNPLSPSPLTPAGSPTQS